MLENRKTSIISNSIINVYGSKNITRIKEVYIWIIELWYGNEEAASFRLTPTKSKIAVRLFSNLKVLKVKWQRNFRYIQSKCITSKHRVLSLKYTKSLVSYLQSSGACQWNSFSMFLVKKVHYLRVRSKSWLLLFKRTWYIINLL